MKREIPQKVDARFGFAGQACSVSVSQLWATLFRRTRSASLLSVALTTGTFCGVFTPHQEAQAFSAISPSRLGTVSTVTQLFNSADAPDRSYQALTALGNPPLVSSNSISELKISELKLISEIKVDSSQVTFEPNAVLSTRLSFQNEPNVLGSSSLGLIADPMENLAEVSLSAETQESLNTAEAIAASVELLNTKKALASEGLEIQEPGAFVHKVEKGENLTEIGNKYQVSPDAIAVTNQLSNPNEIEAHEALVIPAVSVGAVIGTPLSLGALAIDAAAVMKVAKSQGISEKLLAPQQAERSLSDLPAQPLSTESVSTESVRAVQPVSLSAAKDLTSAALPSVGQTDMETAPLAPAPALIDRASAIQEQSLLALQAPKSYSRESAAEATASVSAPLAATSLLARKGALPQIPNLDLPGLMSADQFLPSSLQGGGIQKYIWPARGVFTSGYGWRWGRMHRGIDIAAPVGTPVVASAAGVVVTAGWNDGGFGNLVEIRHPDGALTLYAHNHRIMTRVGAVVNQGELIAQMGSTGRSTGPHTHFEIHRQGSGAVNPMFYLGRS